MVEVLPQAKGIRGDSRLLDSLLSSLRNHGEPGHRVERINHNHPETTDSYAWRVRIYLDPDGAVKRITQACLVELPEGIDNGWELRNALEGLPPPPKPVGGVVGLTNFPPPDRALKRLLSKMANVAKWVGAKVEDDVYLGTQIAGVDNDVTPTIGECREAARLLGLPDRPEEDAPPSA